jgi:2-polyprenyl-6-methoxyphenol hydroxylase-like FAD-dependent oxidoreductase
VVFERHSGRSALTRAFTVYARTLEVRRDGRPDRVVRARWIVGADGMHSTVRQALGMPFPGKPVVRSVMLAEVRLTQPPPDALTVSAPGDNTATAPQIRGCLARWCGSPTHPAALAAGQ